LILFLASLRSYRSQITDNREKESMKLVNSKCLHCKKTFEIGDKVKIDFKTGFGYCDEICETTFKENYRKTESRDDISSCLTNLDTLIELMPVESGLRYVDTR